MREREGERVEARLRRRVGGTAVLGLERADRGHVEDDAAVRHARHGPPREAPDAVQVQVDLAVPELLFDLHRGLRDLVTGETADIVDEDGQPPELPDDLFDGLGGEGAVADVPLHHQAAAAEPQDGIAHLFERLPGAPVDRDVRTRLGEGLRDGTAEPAAAARDQRDSPIQPKPVEDSHHSPHLVVETAGPQPREVHTPPAVPRAPGRSPTVRFVRWTPVPGSLRAIYSPTG